MRPRVRAFISHPIHYLAPLFRAIEQTGAIDFEVWYSQAAPSADERNDLFQHRYEWGVPLREGYRSRILKNTARRPDASSFWGARNPEIRALIAEEQPDLVVVGGYGQRAALAAAFAAYRSPARLAIYGEFSLIQHRRRPNLRALAKSIALRASVARAADAYLAISHDGIDFTRAVLGAPASRAFLAPYAADPSRFHPLHKESAAVRRQIRAQWNLPEDAVAVAFVGKLYDGKRPSDLLEAIYRARVAGDRKLTAIFVGSGPAHRELAERARLDDIPAVFPGFVDYSVLPDTLRACDCLFFSSRRESWGMVVHEGMSVGLPVVGTPSVPSISELVSPGVSGLTFDDGDLAEAARHLSLLAADPSLRSDVGAAAISSASAAGLQAAASAWVTMSKVLASVE